jgi:hypothetical protein
MRIPSGPVPAARRPAGGLRRLLAPAALLVICLLGVPVPAAAADRLPDGVVWTATVNDRNVEGTSSDDPVRLDPGRPADVVVRFENLSDETVEIPFVRLEGEVLQLPLYSYMTQVALTLPPGATDQRSFSIPLVGLGAQASGLIPSRISLLDDPSPDGEAVEISGIDLVVDVRGNATSVYGVFGAAIGALTLMLLAGGLLRLATGRLPVNRWRRALLFAAPGLGLGFLMTFTLSALRVATPEGSLWTSLVLGGGALGFLAGYLSPTPGGADDRADEDGGGAEGDAGPDDVPPPWPGDPDGAPDDDEDTVARLIAADR